MKDLGIFAFLEPACDTLKNLFKMTFKLARHERKRKRAKRGNDVINSVGKSDTNIHAITKQELHWNMGWGVGGESLRMVQRHIYTHNS